MAGVQYRDMNEPVEEREQPLVAYRTALVVVDMQRGFANEHTAHLPDRIADLVNTMAFGHVVFTQFFNGPKSPHRTQMNWHKMRGAPETDLVEPIRELANPVFAKGGYSCFTPEMFRWLGRNEDIDTLCFCGNDTDICILKSAVDAFELNFRPIVLTDCTASHGGKQAHAAGMYVLSRMIGKARLRASDTVLAQLGGPMHRPPLSGGPS